ncbi:MAG: bifunctional diguanylate cyclase/phosphodiesterase [Methylophaga sp.]|nr:MAG: bifunctional diguanylate cyclase/phosphodiesterase [Methylophaga sp.]
MILEMEHSHILSEVILVESYDIYLVIVSILIAIISSFTAFGLADRIHASAKIKYKIAWNICGATTLVLGIWAMHFVGMLALILPVPVYYDVFITVISAIPVILASSLVLWMMTQESFSRRRLLMGSVLLGSGIGLMHYIGMTAMRMNAIMIYDTNLFFASILVAVILATVALKIKYDATDRDQYQFINKRQIISAIVMGIAAAGMPYTAMATTSFAPTKNDQIMVGLEQDTLFIVVSITILVLLILAIIIPLILRYKQTENELKRLIRQEKEDKARIHAIIDSSLDGLIQMDNKGKIVGWNHQAEHIFGWTQDEIMGAELADVIIPVRYRDAHFKGLASFLETGLGPILNQVTEIEALHKDGHEFSVEMTVTPIIITGGNEFNAFVRDISERKRVEAKQSLLAQVFNEAHEGIFITDTGGNIVDVNPTFTTITGYSREEIMGKNPRVLSSGKHGKEFYAEIWGSIMKHGFWQGQLWNRKKNGDLFAEMLSISALKENDITTHYVCLFFDVTQYMEQQKALELMAHYDVLTQLPNRTLFVDRVSQAISHAKRKKRSIAICFLDLDDFKPINDNYGHSVGDQILIEVAARIKANIRESDTVSRQGGDEFTLLLGDIEYFSQCKEMLKRILHSLAQSYSIDQHSHQISASIGVTVYPQDNNDLDTLMRHADQAMYQAKLLGKNGYHVFDASDAKEIQQKQVELQEIEQGLTNSELCLYYQPKINMKTGKVYGLEALIRWQHPEKGLIPPIGFLPTIEGTALEIQIGDWVINEALTQVDSWQQQGIELEISINISSYHLQSTSFFSELDKALTNHPNIHAMNVQLEILESSALGDLTAINTIIQSCRKTLGVQIALDDFGTGYSSLAHMRNLPVNTVKIDRSFVRDMLGNPGDYAIIDGILGLADSFNLDVIAEGVESTEHGLMLLIMGCEQAQGYGIAYPMPAIDFPQWFADYKPNLSWIKYGRNGYTEKENKATLLKLTTEYWFNNINARLYHGDKNNDNPLTLTKCHLGAWLGHLRKEQLFNMSWLDELQLAHNTMYAIGNKLIIEYQKGELDSAKRSFKDLETRYQIVLAILERCE